MILLIPVIIVVILFFVFRNKKSINMHKKNQNYRSKNEK